MNLRETEDPSRRMVVSGIVWPRRTDGTYDTLSPVAGEIEMLASNDVYFSEPGVLEREVAQIRDSEPRRFTTRPGVIGLGFNPEIRFQKPRTINLGRIGVLHLNSWQTIQRWPYRTSETQD